MNREEGTTPGPASIFYSSPQPAQPWCNSPTRCYSWCWHFPASQCQSCIPPSRIWGNEIISHKLFPKFIPRSCPPCYILTAVLCQNIFSILRVSHIFNNRFLDPLRSVLKLWHLQGLVLGNCLLPMQSSHLMRNQKPWTQSLNKYRSGKITFLI